MSKYVKELMTEDLRRRLVGVDDLLLVNVVGMDANNTMVLRRTLRDKKIHLTVVRNSLARRATEGTPLAVAFEGVEGTTAVLWGGEDLISLAKEVARLADDKQFAPFEPRGGVMDGAQLSPQDVVRVSKWPSRQEQLSLLVGQVLSPGAKLASQLLGPGGKLASQLEKIEKKGDEAKTEEGAAEAAVE